MRRTLGFLLLAWPLTARAAGVELPGSGLQNPPGAMVNTLASGFRCDGSNESTALSAANAAAASANAVLFLPCRVKVTSGTIDIAQPLKSDGPGGIDLSTGAATVTVRGPVDAPLAQIFYTGSGTLSFQAKVSEVHPAWFGVSGSGADESASLNAAIAAAMTTGTPLVFPSGTFRADGQILLPNDGATPPKQKPLHIVGAGATMSGRGTGASGGTILDLRYAGSYGKITTTGLGLLEVEGVTFIDTAGSSTPWLYTTNTTFHVHDTAFIGTKYGTECDQDAIILGGTRGIEGQGGLDDGFQGYGTVIERNYFSRVRRILYGRTYANGTVVRDNTVWSNAGSNLSNGACIEFDSIGGQSASGNVILGNLIEMTHYPYAIKLGAAAQNTIAHNNAFDATRISLAVVRLEAGATQNVIIDGSAPGPLTRISDANGRNTHLGIDMQIASTYPEPANFTNGDPGITAQKLTAVGGAGTLTVQPARPIGPGVTPFQVLRSGAEPTAPGEPIWTVGYDGTVHMGPNTALGGNFIGPYSMWTGGGRTWSSVGTQAGQSQGASLTIDTGPGGSYLNLRNLGVRFFDQNGTLHGAFLNGAAGGAEQLRFGGVASPAERNLGIITGTGSPQGAVTAPPGSLYLRRDGGPGTSLYVKESGSGNTGWVAK